VELGGRLGPQAYYILFDSDITGPNWPQNFVQYTLFVVSPQNMTADLITKVKTDIPGSQLIAYWDFNDVPIQSGCSTGHVMGDKPGRNCSFYACGDGPWTESIRSAFSSQWAITDLTKKEVVCLYPGLAAYAWFDQSANAIVELFSNWLNAVPFDGFYLDGFTRLTAYTQNVAPLSGITFDSNGDGEPETMDQLVSQWQSWAPYFVHELRLAIGPDKILVANSAGPLSNADLNGLTIEMEACIDQLSCMNALIGQKSVSPDAAVSVLWLTHSEAMPPAEQCQRVQQFQWQMGWLLAGTDFFDGSHIVCNNTLAL